MMWTSCRVNSKLLHSCLATRADSIDPCSGLLHTSMWNWIWYFSKKYLWNLTKGVFSHCSILVFCQQCCFNMGSPTVASLITSISASGRINHPKDSGKSNPSSLTFIISWWHNVGGLNYPVTRDSASLKVSSSKQHTAGTICILSWLSWWMFKPSIHVRVQYLLFLLNEFPLYSATTDVSDKNCAPPNQKRLFDLTVGPLNSGSCHNAT